MKHESLNHLLLYELDNKQYFLKMKDSVKEEATINILANKLYKDQLKQFWEIQRYACDQSYCFHDMFKKGLYVSMKVITSIDLDSVLYPYQHWMEQPVKFE
jgi:hypothetical protein